ncbi:hypothetical protein ACFFRR_003109 [Megaselia abdita]
MSLRTTYNEVEKIWSGPKRTLLFNPESSVGQVLFMCLSHQSPEKVIQINVGENTRWTCEEVLSKSVKVAYNLQRLDLKQTDILGVIATNTSNLMPLCYGMFFIGVPFHAIDCDHSKESAVRRWAITRPKIIFCDGNKLDFVMEIIGELNLSCEVYTLNEHRSGVKQFDELLQELPNDKVFYPPEITSSLQTAAISNSSGSTGFAKAVTLSHRIISETLSTLYETASDTHICLFSLFWECGILDYLLPAVTGCTNITSNIWFTGDDIVMLVDKYKVTGLTLMPMFVAQMLSSPLIEKLSLKSLTSIFSMGAKLPIEMRRRIEKYLSKSCKIMDNYGNSERSSIMMEVSEGKSIPFFNVEIKIIDEKGQNLSCNQNGEICVRKDSIWSGYFGNKEATDEVYDLNENWYKTEDMGYFDENGYFHFVERIKDIIRLDIVDISPVELEEIILQMDNVAQVCVFGIPHELKSSIVGALVIKKSESKITEKDIEKFVAEKAPDYMHLEGGAYLVDSLPLTSTGKIIRKDATAIGIKKYRDRFD